MPSDMRDATIHTLRWAIEFIESVRPGFSDGKELERARALLARLEGDGQTGQNIRGWVVTNADRTLRMRKGVNGGQMISVWTAKADAQSTCWSNGERPCRVRMLRELGGEG